MHKKNDCATWMADKETLNGGLSSAHSRTRLVAHITWSTRGRSPILRGLMTECVESLRSHFEESKIHVLAIAVLPDHVHLLLRYLPSQSLAAIVGRAKTSVRQALDEGTLWQSGYFAESIGWKNPAQIAHYICRQKEHHA